MEKYKRFKEGERYNTNYLIAGKDLKGGEKIDTLIGVLEEFIIELKRWKKQGFDNVGSMDKGEFIPLKK